MNSEATKKKIEEMEYHAESILQIAASLRKDLKLEEGGNSSSSPETGFSSKKMKEVHLLSFNRRFRKTNIKN